MSDHPTPLPAGTPIWYVHPFHTHLGAPVVYRTAVVDPVDDRIRANGERRFVWIRVPSYPYADDDPKCTLLKYDRSTPNIRIHVEPDRDGHAFTIATDAHAAAKRIVDTLARSLQTKIQQMETELADRRTDWLLLLSTKPVSLTVNASAPIDGSRK